MTGANPVRNPLKIKDSEDIGSYAKRNAEKLISDVKHTTIEGDLTEEG